MEYPQLIIFHYGESDRVVCPFVLGVSSQGNPLMRGYQVEGVSRSGKGPGWRVYQIKKMENIENYQDFFDTEDLDFNEIYPWTFKVFKMLETRIPIKERELIEKARPPVEGEVFVEEEEFISIWDELRNAINKEPDLAGKDQVTLDWLKKYHSSSTTPIAGPSTDIEHEAYSSNLDGITLYFDDLDDAVVTITREMISGPSLPKTLKDQFNVIQIVSEDARGGPDVVAMHGDGVITIFGGRQVDRGVIAHEASHGLAISKWGDVIPPAGSDYSAAIDSGEPAPSEYAARNRGEDFTEAVKMFVVNPEELERISPTRYRVIKRLMEEKDYGG